MIEIDALTFDKLWDDAAPNESDLDDSVIHKSLNYLSWAAWNRGCRGLSQTIDRFLLSVTEPILILNNNGEPWAHRIAMGVS